MIPKLLKIGVVHFAGCSGCQLMLLNCEAELAILAQRVDCVDASMITSATCEETPFDLLLVEGSITSPSEQQHLQKLRLRCRHLVAVGACALTGGINRFDAPTRETACTHVYGPVADQIETFSPQPVANFVAVDACIPGCPPEHSDFLDFFGALSCGVWPTQRDAPVCMECRTRELRCLLEEDHLPCLGPITIGGCAARCPALGIPCEGCRGEVSEANRDELCHLMAKTHLSKSELKRRIQRFTGGENV